MEVVAAQQLAPITPVDEMLVRLWLHARPANTASAYERDGRGFLVSVAKPIAAITLDDLQAYAASLAQFSEATRARRLAVVKSLFKFGVTSGVLTVNPAIMLRIAKPRATTADRILSEADVARMIGGETKPRLRALLRLLYLCGLRASEAAALKWRDMAGSEKRGGEARILGKGAKLRTVVIPADLWRELAALSPAALPDSPVIPGHDGGEIDRDTVHRAVKRAARRAGVNAAASPHWLRHSSATHALTNGAPIHVVQQRLGHASLTTTSRYLHITADQGMAAYLKA